MIQYEYYLIELKFNKVRENKQLKVLNTWCVWRGFVCLFVCLFVCFLVFVFLFFVLFFVLFLFLFFVKTSSLTVLYTSP